MDLLTSVFKDQDTYQVYLKDLSVPPHPSTMEPPEMNSVIRQKLASKVKLTKKERLKGKDAKAAKANRRRTKKGK